MFRLETFKLPTRILMLITLALVLTACGGGGGGGGSTTVVAPIGDISGTWNVTENVDESACGGSSNATYQYQLIAAQSGNSVTVSDNTGTYTGTLSGNNLTWSGSFPEDGGTVQSSASLFIDASCNSLSGTASWTWTGPVSPFSCSGTTQVTAIRVSPDGCGSSTVTVPNAPTGLFASAASSSSINLSWSDNSGDESNFVVQRSLSSSSGFATIITLSADTTSYTNSGLSASTTYYYRVYATNTAGSSGNSNVANATTSSGTTTAPIAPSGLFASSVYITSASLAWVDNSNDETGFKIESSTSSSTGPFTQIATTSANVASYNPSLIAGTTYYFRARAFNGGGNSAFSNVKTITTGDSAPVLSVPSSAGSGASYSISWTYGWGSGGLFASSQDGFELQRSTSSTTGFTTVYSTMGNGDRSPSCSVTDSQTTGTYFYRVRARHNTVLSNWSNVDSITIGSSTVTNTYTAAADNLLLTSSTNSASANTAFPTAENAVGCNWLYSFVTGIQDFVCAISLIYFDVNADISGKTVSSATLKLYTEILPASFTQYKVWATFDNWSASVTWNTQPLIYTGSGVIFNQPTSSLPSEINVTNIVQNWANGNFNNFGFFVEDTSYTFPFATQLRSTTYCSKEGVPSCTRPPELVITYQ